MSEQRVWRPIAECPPELRRAVVFDPDNACLSTGGSVADERVISARRQADGTWWVEQYDGSARVAPTHFLDPGVPAGFPSAPDPEALRARADAERAAAEREQAAFIAAQITLAQGRDAEAERYWAEVAAEAAKTRGDL